MGWPKWIEDNKWRWLIGLFVAAIIPIVLYFLSGENKDTQSVSIIGDNNTSVQIDESPGATVNINKIDPEELARKVAKHLKDQRPEDKDAEIQELKATIERLQQDTANELKQAALHALSEDDVTKAAELMEKAALERTEQVEKLTTQAAQDWIDYGNIAYLSDSQKALKAYERAIELDDSNWNAWNRYGHIQIRLGLLDEAQQAYKQVFKLAGDNKSIRATAYGNLGIIYQIRGELDKAEELYMKSLEIDKTLGQKESMAIGYGNLGILYQIRREFDKAEKFHLKSLEINQIIDRKRGMASQYCNLGIIYKIRGELDKAEKFHLKSLEIDKTLGQKEGIAGKFHNIVYTC